jgi:membrane protein implicated in regulation of membrane protease activity
MAPLPPVTRRIVGMMTVLAGFMLLVAFFLRMGVTYFAYQQAGTAALYNRELLMSLLLLVGSMLLLRYGWRTLRPHNDMPD